MLGSQDHSIWEALPYTHTHLIITQNWQTVKSHFLPRSLIPALQISTHITSHPASTLLTTLCTTAIGTTLLPFTPACTHPTPPTQQKLLLAHSEIQQGTLMDVKDFVQAQAECKSPLLLTLTFALGANIDLSNLLSKDDHRARHLVCKQQQYQGNRPISLELQTVYKSLHFTSVL